ncbi:MAG: MFS transporter [Candidatus Dactylopiibacterium sp.]|nr:MFS transporter [Candidatus Dactylopiibacterium sp.]
MLPSASCRPGRAGIVLAIIMTSYLMIVVDISIVLTGLPRIRDALGFSAAGLSWVQNAYTLSFGGFLLLGARAGDLLGRRRMFVSGLAIFTLTSLAIGLAPSATALLAARAVQGFGAAILAPATLALLATHFPEEPQRTRALAWYAAAAGVGATLGLVLGGLLTDLVSWRAGFFLNLPVGLLLIAGARRYLDETPRLAGRFDLAGAICATLGMSACVFGIVEAAQRGWGAPLTLASLATGLALLGIFLVVQTRVAHPVLPLRLFRDAARNGAYAARLLFLAGMVGFWFFTAQYLQGVLGFSPLLAGLAFVPVTLPNFASAMAVPRLARRFGMRRLLLGGLALSVLGLGWQGAAAAQASYVVGVAIPMLLTGLAQGCVLAPLTLAGVAGVPAHDAGAASGVVNVAHQLGASLGLAVLVVVFAQAEAPHAQGTAALAVRTGVALQASALLVLLALLVSANYIGRPARDAD